MNVPLWKGNGYTGLIQRTVYSQVCLIQGFKILFCGHPVSHADIYTGIRKFLNSDLRSRFIDNCGDLSQSLLYGPGCLMGIIIIGNSDGQFDHFIFK